jgi:hypothetical protein
VKTCTKCKVEKTRDSFGVAPGNRDGLRGDCKQCRKDEYRANIEERKAKSKAHWDSLDMEERWNRNLTSRYGITPDFYWNMAEAQGYKCASCKTPKPGNGHRRFVVDHDHDCCPYKAKKYCGKCVRGLLCYACNTAEGYLRDPEHARALALYMERNGVIGNG